MFRGDRMTYERLNRMVRWVLVLTALLSFGLFVVAARPTVRYQGVILGSIGTPQPLLDESSTPALYVTIRQPAVVSFPDAWKLSDQVCMAVHFERGSAPPSAPIDDYVPQAQWDQPWNQQYLTNQLPSDALIIAPTDIDIRTDDGSKLALAGAALWGNVEALTPYRVHWFGTAPLILTHNQVADRLLCYYFQNDSHQLYVPFTHMLRFGAQNVQMSHMPGFAFVYSQMPQSPETIRLQKMPMAAYFELLSAQSSPVLTLKTSAQLDQRATETASTPIK